MCKREDRTPRPFRSSPPPNPILKSWVSRITSSSCSYSKVLKNSSLVLNSKLGDLSTNYYFENPSFKIPRRWHVGHTHHHPHHDDGDSHSGKEGENIFRLGLAADIGLAAGKAVTGYLSGITAIIADTAHSVSDVVLSGVALLSFKAARAPKDKEHPYGHGKFETLEPSEFLMCFWQLLEEIWAAAPEIVNQSLAHNHTHGGHNHGIDMKHTILALNMTIISIAVKEGLYWITKRAGEKTGSDLMKANAWHQRADSILSVVALIGAELFSGLGFLILLRGFLFLE